MLARVDAINADIAALRAKIEEQTAPFRPAVARLDEIPGIKPAAAQVILAEIGLYMQRFPNAGHLVSWAKFAPLVKESAGKKKRKNATGQGNAYLARVLGNAAVADDKNDTFLGERYRRIARRRGRKKANVAIGRSQSWSSSGTCSPTTTPVSTTSAPTSAPPASAPNAANAATSANSKPSATRSPSNRQPDRPSAIRRWTPPADGARLGANFGFSRAGCGCRRLSTRRTRSRRRPARC
jgi:hypothetical protein